MLNVKCFVCGPLENNVYVVIDDEAKACALIDPGIEAGSVHRYIAEQGLKVEWLLLTHGHFDHAYSLGHASELYPDAQTAAHPGAQHFLDQIVATASMWGFMGASACPEINVWLEHGGSIQLGSHSIEVRHTPGHSPGQVAFIFDGQAIVGDTLFCRSVGRTDLPGSNHSDLERSITEQLYTLPDETVVHPGHGPATTIGEEKRENPFVRG